MSVESPTIDSRRWLKMNELKTYIWLLLPCNQVGLTFICYEICTYITPADYRNASILDEPNPLSLSNITITAAANDLPRCVKPKSSVIEKVGVSLQLILKREFGDAYEDERSVDEAKKIMEDRGSLLAHRSPAAALAALKAQLKAYFNREDPFNRKKRENKTAREWWMELTHHEDADVLAVSYFLQVIMLSWLNHGTYDSTGFSSQNICSDARFNG